MFNKDFLNDNWYVSGTDLETLKNVIEENDKYTKFIETNSKDISLISLLSKEIKEKLKLNTEKDYVFKSNPNPHPFEILLVLSAYKTISAQSRKDISIYTPTKEMLSSSLFSEFKVVKTMMSLNGENYFLSSGFFKNLERYGVSGEFYTTPSFERDLSLTATFANEKPAIVCVKEFDGNKKAFALLSGKYTNINQNVLFRIIDMFEKKMGTIDVKSWEMNHFITNVYVEFPQYADDMNEVYKFKTKYIPGILISTSDTGDCALKIRGTLRKEDTTAKVYFKEISRKHIGNIDINKLMNEIEKGIFEKYTLIPDKMIELMSIDISPDDLSTENARFENTEIIKLYIDFLVKESQLVKAVGKKAKDTIKKALYDIIDDRHNYTLYDIVDEFMILPEVTIGLNGYALDKLRNCVAKAPFIDFNRCKKIKIEL